MFGNVISEIGNVSDVVEIGESFQSEKDRFMSTEAVENPPMTTVIQNSLTMPTFAVEM